jgi:hypothetical protein
MIWTLSSTTFRCTARRLRTLAAENPLVAAVAAVFTATAPIAAAVAGVRVGRDAVDAAARDPALARAAALAIALDAVLAGAAVVALAPGTGALGPQLGVAPVPRTRAAAGLRVMPALGAAGALAVPAASFLVAAIGTARPLLVVATLAGGVAAFACGGAAVDAGRALATAPARGAGALCGLGAIWSGGAYATGDGLAVGPLGVLPAAITGGTAAEAAAVAAVTAVAVAAAALWLLAAAADDVRRPARVRFVVLPVPPSTLAAAFAAALKTYGRQRALRQHAFATVAVAAGVALATRRVLPTAAEDAAIAGLLVGVAGASVFPLAPPALDAPARWLWRAAPTRRPAVRAVRAAAAVVLAGAVVVAAFGVVEAAPGPGAAVAGIAAAAALAFAGATVAGLAVPWRADAVVDQVASYAGAAVVAGALGVAAARAVSAAPGPDTVAGAVVLGAILAAAIAATAAAEAAA